MVLLLIYARAYAWRCGREGYPDVLLGRLAPDQSGREWIPFGRGGLHHI